MSIFEGTPGNDSLIGTDQDDELYGRAGDDTLDGGAGNDILDGDEGNDSLTGGGGDDELEGREGNDTLVGGLGNDVLHGREGDDLLDGGTGDDSMIGFAGADLLDGGDGVDVLDGGAGIDIVLAGPGDDYIIRGGSGDDTIDGGDGFDHARFDDDGSDAAGPAFQGVVVNLVEGFATDGWGGNDTLIAIEAVDGGALDDQLIGDANPNSLYGQGGNDLLDGGGGDDLLEGGDGNDTLVGGDGIDVLHARAGDDVLQGGAGDDSMVGFAGDDRLEGGGGVDVLEAGAGNDTILAGDGDDYVIRGGSGDDVIDGGDGFDHVRYDDVEGDAAGAAFQGVVVNLAEGSAIDGWGGRDTLTGIEAADGDALDDTLTGDDGPNSLYGQDGNDLLDGAGGDDLLEGGDGNDTLVGGDGIDVLHARAGNDVLQGGAGDDSMVGFAGDDRLEGGGGVDVLEAGAGNDTILAGDGDDYVIRGGSGDDVIDGGDGFDHVRYDDVEGDAAGPAFQGVSVNLVEGSAIDGWGGSDTLVGLEAVDGGPLDDTLIGDANPNSLIGQAGNDSIQGGGGDDFLDGSDGDDTLAGGAGNDTLWGRAGDDDLDGGDGDDSLDGFSGNDRLDGGAGVDVLYGGAGNDVLLGGDGDDYMLHGGSGDDTLDGGAGFDQASYEDEGSDEAGPATQAVVINLAEGFAIDGWGDRDTLISIEQVQGGPLGDTILGNDDDNILDGGAGADELRGGAGRDTYFVDDAGDLVIEEDGIALSARVSLALLRGRLRDAGAELRDNDVAGDVDKVVATVSYALTDFVENLTLDGTEAIDGNGNTLDNVISGNSAANVLRTGLGDDDRLSGGAGTDTFVVEKTTGKTRIKDLGEGDDLLELSQFLAGQSAGSLQIGFAGTTLLIENVLGGVVAIRAFLAVGDNPVTLIDLGDGAVDLSTTETAADVANLLGAVSVGAVAWLVDEDENYWDASAATVNDATLSSADLQLFRTYSGALGRDPDDAGYAWWANEITEGRHDLRSMAAGFIYSDEFKGIADTNADAVLDNVEFLTHMYRSVFEREPDNEGFAWWLDQLETGNRTQTDALVEMTQSNEYVELTLYAALDYLVA